MALAVSRCTAPSHIRGSLQTSGASSGSRLASLGGAAGRMHVAVRRGALGPARSGRGAVLRVQASASAAATVTEPATGTVFPPTLALPGISTNLTLLGTGVREKKFAIIAVKVYAAAFYLDVAASPASWQGKTGQDLLNSLAQVPADKAIVLALVRDITSKQFVDALNDELLPKLKAAGADLGVLEQLGALFKDRPLKKDSAVLLAWRQPSTLLVSFVDNVKEGYMSTAPPSEVESSELLGALFDLYLGLEPVAPSLASSVINVATQF